MDANPEINQTAYTSAAIKSDQVTNKKPSSTTKQADEENQASSADKKVSKPSTKQPKVAVEVKYPPASNNRSPLGINTNEIYEQDASIPFVDLFRVSMPFHENIRCRKQDMPCLTSAEV